MERKLRAKIAGAEPRLPQRISDVQSDVRGLRQDASELKAAVAGLEAPAGPHLILTN